jgi:hypothetical protein
MHKHLTSNIRGRDFVVGDLHGSFELFQNFLTYINFDPFQDRMISVGDLVDRGPDSIACLRLLNEPWFHAVLANHEELMMDFLGSTGLGMWWMPNGGRWWNQITPELQNEVRDMCEKTVKNLPLVISVDKADGTKFHVIHAEISWDQELVDADMASTDMIKELNAVQSMDGGFLTWGRDLFKGFYKRAITDKDITEFARQVKLNNLGAHFGPKLGHIFSGHTTVHVPTTILGQTNLDTGAFNTFKGMPGGLSFVEPNTGKFWTTDFNGTREVTPVVIL